jgi:hypothetical protein
LVWPLKIVNPGNVDPGPPFDVVTVNIVVVNYGNPTGAELTDIIDRMPPEMSFIAGSCNIIPGPSVPCNLAGNTVTWSFSPARNIPQNQFVLATFQARVNGLNPGDIINNEAETRGDNFDTSTYIRRIYAYTPTPTPVVPVAVDDIVTTNEDVPIDIYVMNNNGNGPDTNLLENPFSITVTSGPSFGTTPTLLERTTSVLIALFINYVMYLQIVIQPLYLSPSILSMILRSPGMMISPRMRIQRSLFRYWEITAMVPILTSITH